jgi:ferredoxin
MTSPARSGHQENLGSSPSIAEPCIGVKDNACVDACPVDCIHPKKNTTYEDGRPSFEEVPQLYIDPVECIDCGACVPVCPLSAIFALEDSSGEVEALRGTAQTSSSKVSGFCFFIRQKAGPDRAIICTHADPHGHNVRRVPKGALHSHVARHQTQPGNSGNVSFHLPISLSRDKESSEKETMRPYRVSDESFEIGFAEEGAYEMIQAA